MKTWLNGWLAGRVRPRWCFWATVGGASRYFVRAGVANFNNCVRKKAVAFEDEPRVPQVELVVRSRGHVNKAIVRPENGGDSDSGS